MRWPADAPRQRWLLIQEAAMLQRVDRKKAGFAGVSDRRRWWRVPAAAVGCVPQGVQTPNRAGGQDG